MGAFRAFEDLPDSVCVGCGFDRLTRARLLLATRRDSEATQFLTPELSWIPRERSIASVLWDLYRGIAAERNGDQARAAQAYGRVERLWRNADAELAPYLRQAREGLARLKTRPR